MFYGQSIKNKLLLVLGLVLVSCASMEKEGMEAGGGEMEEILSLQNVSPIEVSSSGEAFLDFNQAKASDEYLITLYSSPPSSNSSFLVKMGSRNMSPIASGSFLKSSDIEEDEEGDDALENQLRSLEEDLVNTHSHRRVGASFLRSDGDPAAVRNFKVLASMQGEASYKEVTAQLVYEGPEVLVYLDQRNFAALSQEEIENMVKPFEGIMEKERNIFGEESDVNADGKVALLFTQAVNELGYAYNGFTSGYFYAVDLYPKSSYPNSNEMEVIYSMIPDPQGDYGPATSRNLTLVNIVPTTLPHEFQHLINFSRRVMGLGHRAEESFLNEALSHLAEDIYSNQDGYMINTSIENPSRVNAFLQTADRTCFTCGINLEQRGGAYLFLRYLYEQAELGNLSSVTSGAELIDNLMESPLTGKANLSHAALGDEDGFETLMGLFGLTLSLAGIEEVNNDHFMMNGIDLYGIQDDNRNTQLRGPSIQPYSQASDKVLSLWGLRFIRVSGEDILNNQGSLKLQFSSSQNVGGYLVKVH